jgi:hypothetical protein
MVNFTYEYEIDGNGKYQSTVVYEIIHALMSTLVKTNNEKCNLKLNIYVGPYSSVLDKVLIKSFDSEYFNEFTKYLYFTEMLEPYLNNESKDNRFAYTNVLLDLNRKLNDNILKFDSKSIDNQIINQECVSVKPKITVTRTPLPTIQNIGQVLEDNFDLELETLKNKIEKAKENKSFLNNTIKEVKKNIEEDTLKLSDYRCEFNRKEQLKKYNENKSKSDEQIFDYNRNNIYKKIYEDFFINKIIQSFSEVPIMFMTIFPIFLYLEGKNMKGEDINDNLLYSEDAFYLYQTLFNAITNEKFIFPEDEDEVNFINEFLEMYPSDLPIVTNEDIHNTFEEHKIFTSDETGYESCSDEERDDYIAMAQK